MTIYLDIDGVLLAMDLRPAPYADEFIKFLVENYEVYWLTTHCREPGDNPAAYLSGFFNEDTVKNLEK